MKKNAFTLIELLVAISIIAILSVVGFVSFQNVRAKALDAKRKADIDAIKKAYETNFDPTANGGQGGYKPLQDSMFASGKIPSPPEGGSYMSYIGPGSTDNSNSLPGQNVTTNAAYKVCAALSGNTSSCATSTQGDTSLITQVNSLLNSSCDPTGSLALGLIGYWKMNETSGTTAADSSSNGNNGVLRGPIWTTGGKSNGGLSFTSSNNSGTGDYITINDANSLHLTSFTLGAWIYGRETGRMQRIINGGNAWYDFRIHSGNQYQLEIWNGSLWSSCTTGTFTANTWHYITATHDGAANLSQWYIDGVKTGSVCSITASPRNSSIYIGGNQTNEGYNGKMDDVRIYNRALSANEVSLLYNSGNGCF